MAAEHFQTFVFEGANQARVPVDFAAELQKKGKPSELVQTSGNGKNAADFHMAFYLRQLASKDPDAYFHVISWDTGFAPLIAHLTEKHQRLAKRWPSNPAEEPFDDGLVPRQPARAQRVHRAGAHAEGFPSGTAAPPSERLPAFVEPGEVGVIDEDAVAPLSGEFASDAQFDQSEHRL